MTFKQRAAVLVGILTLFKDPPPRDERGLSQSAETAIIVAGAVAIALVVVASGQGVRRQRARQDLTDAGSGPRRARPQ